MTKTTAFVFLIFICIGAISNAQTSNPSYSVHDIYLESQSIGDEVYVTFQDSKGYLWIGTDNGVRKYDGYTFKQYNHDPNDSQSIGSNFVFSIMQDSNGQLWFTGNNNISLYDQKTETFTVYNSPDGNIMRTIIEGHDGLIWFGGDKSPLYALDPSTGNIVHSIPLAKSRLFDIRSIIRGNKNESLIIASGNGLFRLNTVNLQLENIALPANFILGRETIRQAIIDTNKHLWVATNQGVLLFDPFGKLIEHFTSTSKNDSSHHLIQLVDDEIWSVFQDSNETIWFGTEKKGVYQYNQKSQHFYHFQSSIDEVSMLPLGTNYNIYEDDQHSIWITFNTFGIRRLSKNLKKFNTLKRMPENENSLSMNNVLDLFEATTGDIYIATDGGGLNKYNPVTGEYVHFLNDPNDPKSISSDSVLSIAQGKDEQLWVGTWSGGLNLLDTQTGQFSRIQHSNKSDNKHGLANNNIFRIETLHDGRLLLSVWTLGMQIYDPAANTFESYFVENNEPTSGIRNSAINDFAKASANKYWLGGVSGLELFDVDTKQFTYHLSEQQVGTIYDVLPTASDEVWLATSNGLVLYNPLTKSVKKYRKADGLSDNFVVSLERDLYGHIWIGTRTGLSQFKPESQTFQNYDLGDGLAGMQYNRFSHLKTSTGEIYFGSVNGISIFNPSRLPKNTAKPNIVITSVELFQQPVNIGFNSILKQSIDVTKEIILDYDQRDISFEFTALNFVSPVNNRYRYRLEGLEPQFTEVDSSRRRARYTNLDPGKYTFIVTGSNNDGVWNDEGISIDLIVNNPWWQSWWTKLGVLLMIVAAVKYQSKTNSRRRAILRQMVNEKTVDLNNANLELERASKVAHQLNIELEQRVKARTHELSKEVDERRSAEAKMFHMAFHDALTNLPNRQWLVKRLEELLGECKETTGFRFALLFLDGDKFKHINDSRGHLVGDQVLIETTHRLRLILPEGCQAVRLGGDEFTVLVEGNISEQKVLSLGEMIIAAFKSPLVVNRSSIPFRMSIGMVICDHHYSKTEQVLRDADIAMYKAKELGRGSYQLFDKQMRDETLETIALEQDMESGLRNGEFFVVYQPIVNMENQSVVGFEALARWKHPKNGFISPDVFIPLAEESGFILRIGEWVLNAALKQLKSWHEETEIADNIMVSVNLSAKQLKDVNLVTQVRGALDENGIDGKFLKLEITESALMENTKLVQEVLTKLHTYGIEFAIDDFGTGYSSLAYLGQLPVQYLKIDRAFVNDLFNDSLKNKDAFEIITAIVSLAHNLNINVVAEGIETQAQYALLKKLKCAFGQGYLFSKPLDVFAATQHIIDAATKLK